MSTEAKFSFSLLLLAFAVSTSPRAEAVPTIAEIENLLRENFTHTVEYEESRESVWLQTPVISKGTMQSIPPMLEKRTQLPFPQIWRLYPDHMQWTGPAESKTINFSQAPQLGALANALRSVVLGEFTALNQEFFVEVLGAQANWSVQLKPRSDNLGRYLRLIQFEGAESMLKKIVVLETGGEKTVTTFK
jgi:hypothetical protein